MINYYELISLIKGPINNKRKKAIQ